MFREGLETEGTIVEVMGSQRFTVETSAGDRVLSAFNTRLARQAHRVRVGDRVRLLLDLNQSTPGKIFDHAPAEP